MRLSLSLALLFTAALTATPIHYDVTIDTSGLTGSGFLDFQFNPGSLPMEDATATISNFSMGTGSLNGAPTNNGGVSSDLPNLVLSLLDFFNASYQPVTWGDEISFRVTFSGTLIESPDPFGTIGAAFSVGLFNNLNGMIVSPLIAVDLMPAGGAHLATSFDPIATIQREAPEPSAAAFGLAGLALVGFAQRRRR